MGKIMLNEIDYSGGNANVIRLTQAEYDALPPSKLTDNNVYMITDTNGDGSQFQPVIYSEDEREIGVWVDGKPLYEKTFIFIPTDNNFYIDVASLNIDKVVENRGSIYQDSGNIVPIPYYTANSDFAIAYYNNANNANRLGIVQNSDGYNLNVTWVVTWKYTKTTDTAGSGTWTPQGVPAVHYSTDEKVIGTWIDGSTVYEKTFELSNSIIVNNSNWTSTGISKENINKIICCNGMTPDGTYWGDLCATINVNSYINLLTGRNGDTEEVKWFTIQYIKTTT